MMTEADWQREAQRDPATLTRVEMPSLWRSKAFVTIVALALVIAVGALSRVHYINQLVFATPAHAFIGCDGCGGHAYGDQRGGSSGGGGGNWEPMRGSGENCCPPRSYWDAAREFFRSMIGKDDRPGASVDRTDRRGNRGGAHD